MNKKHKGFLIPILLVGIAVAGAMAAILSANSRNLIDDLKRTRTSYKTANMVKSVTAWAKVNGNKLDEGAQIELDVSELDLQNSSVSVEVLKDATGNKKIKFQIKTTNGKREIVKRYLIIPSRVVNACE